MKKGFTLVELLATIVILAIVSLITIPVITGVINKTRLNSLKSSAYGLLEASNLYYAQYSPGKVLRFDIDNNIVVSNDTTHLIKYKGSIKEGTLILNKNGKVTVCITDGKNSAYKNYNETKVTLVEKNKCYIPDNTSIVYLDNGATIIELSNQELTDKVNELERLVSQLQSEKANKSEVTTALDTLVTKNELSQANANLSSEISSINTSLINKYNILNGQLSDKMDNWTLIGTGTSVDISSNNIHEIQARLYYAPLNITHTIAIVKDSDIAGKRFFSGYGYVQGTTPVTNTAAVMVSADGKTLSLQQMFVDSVNVAQETSVKYYAR